MRARERERGREKETSFSLSTLQWELMKELALIFSKIPVMVRLLFRLTNSHDKLTKLMQCDASHIGETHAIPRIPLSIIIIPFKYRPLIKIIPLCTFFPIH